MASPMILVFCTPDVKTPSRANSTLSRSPETNELPLPTHTQTPQFPDFETRWLKTEAKVVNSNYVHFDALFTTSSLGFFSNTTFSYVIVEDLSNGNFVRTFIKYFTYNK